MGVLNCTPDSFSDGGRFLAADAAVAHARRMIVEGVDIVDIGGESTRPGSLPVDPAEQIRRTIPVIEHIRSFWDGPISIDTTKAEVARAALAAGANWINDISAFRDDDGMADIAAKSGSMVVLMHMQGTPRTMQTAPDYSDVVTEVRDFLQERANFALGLGVKVDRLVVDPGIGFGKRQDDNLAILGNLPRIAELGFPVLVGASRKSFIGKITGDDTPDRLEGSLAAAVWAALHGARIVRVHDVAATRKALRVAESIAGAQAGRSPIP